MIMPSFFSFFGTANARVNCQSGYYLIYKQINKLYTKISCSCLQFKNMLRFIQNNYDETSLVFLNEYYTKCEPDFQNLDFPVFSRD